MGEMVNKIHVQVKFKKLRPNAIAPAKAHSTDAAFDLFSAITCTVSNGQIAFIPIGIAVEIPDGYEMQIRPRSGLAARYGLTVINSPGTIDAGYRGEITVIATIAVDGRPLPVRPGDRIAQAVICKLPNVEFVETELLSGSTRGTSGMGSTGVGEPYEDDESHDESIGDEPLTR